MCFVSSFQVDVVEVVCVVNAVRVRETCLRDRLWSIYMKSRGLDPCECVLISSTNHTHLHHYQTHEQMRFWAVHEATSVECGLISFCSVMYWTNSLFIFTQRRISVKWAINESRVVVTLFYSIANFPSVGLKIFSGKTFMKQKNVWNCKNVNVAYKMFSQTMSFWAKPFYKLKFLQPWIWQHSE